MLSLYSIVYWGAVCLHHLLTGQREVAMLQPFTRKDLMIRSLPDRLKDCPQMMTLFPNKPKDQVFGSFYR